MTRYFLILLFFVSTSCVSSGQQSPSGKASPFSEFKGFGKFYTGADPDRISNSARYIVHVEKYKEPIPFRYHVSVRLFNSGINGTLTRCGEFLGTNAKSPTEIQKLTKPFEQLAMREINERGSAIKTSDNMLFSVIWEISDVPTSLSKNAPTNFCLVRTKMEVGERLLVDPATGEDYTHLLNSYSGSLPPQEDEPLFEQELRYFVSAEKLRHVMEIELLEKLSQVLPTLNGEILDQCGIFEIDPVKECTRYYSRQILIQEEALRCASDAQDRPPIIAEINRIKGRLEAMSSKMDMTGSYYVEEQCP